MKELPIKDKKGQPKFLNKRMKGVFVCDLDDIKFVDKAIKENGDYYKNKCLITHANKGDILIDHTLEEVSSLMSNKIIIKGYRR